MNDGAKIVLLGSSGAGKTRLIETLRNGSSNKMTADDLEPTTGCQFFLYSVPLSKSYIKINIWDTSGNERYWKLLRLYYADAKGIIVLFSIIDQHSFNVAKCWIEELRAEKLDTRILAIVGTHKDKPDQRCVDSVEAAEFTDSQSIVFSQCFLSSTSDLHFPQISKTTKKYHRLIKAM